MNLTDAKVIRVISEPIHRLNSKVDYWLVNVVAVDMGGEHDVTLTFKTEQEALKVKIGYEFQH